MDRDDRYFKEVRSAYYVALEFNIVWHPVMDSIVYILTGYADLFFCFRMYDVPGTYKGVH